MVQPIRLSRWLANEKASISTIDETSSEIIRKLVALGLVPGQEVEIIRKIPIYILKIGHTQVAVDEELIRNVYVIRRSEPSH